MAPGYVTLYLDESGGKNWPTPWGADPHVQYVLAGLCMTPEQDVVAHQGVAAILDKFFPAPGRRPAELHYGDIINKRGPYSYLTDAKRKEVADDVFALIRKCAPTLMGSVVKKDFMKQRYGANAHPPNEYALRATIDRFDRHLEETQSVGMVIMDTESRESDRGLRLMVHNAKHRGIRVGGIGYLPMADRKLTHVLNTISFSESHMSPGIQLADFIAYATWSHHERGRSNRWNEITGLWRTSGHFREPSIIPRERP